MNIRGFLVIAAVLAAALCAIKLVARAEKPSGSAEAKEPVDKRFDERQLIARGKANGHALNALIGYLVANYLLCAHLGRVWTQPGVDAFIGVYFALAVFSIECVCRDAYFKVGENVRKNLWWMWLSTLAMAVLFVFTLVRHTDTYVVGGLVTFDAIFPAMMVYYIAMNAVLTWRVFAAEREEAA